jgi:transposase-like protein
MARYINQAKKDEVLLAVKNGLSVTEASAQHAVSAKAIYVWLKAQADNTGTSSLEVSRLRRENQELKEIIGMFALDKKRAEKNTKGA